MTEHFIRLRGGWTLTLADGETRHALPSTTLRSQPSGFVLTRPFHAPSGLGPGDTVALRMEQVPGVRRIRLNGRLIFESSAMSELPAELDVTGMLVGRCVLVLEVGGSDWNAPAEGWGHVAVVIRAREGG